MRANPRRLGRLIGRLDDIQAQLYTYINSEAYARSQAENLGEGFDESTLAELAAIRATVTSAKIQTGHLAAALTAQRIPEEQE